MYFISLKIIKIKLKAIFNPLININYYKKWTLKRAF
jgi:hypothetical protein